jgi:hypothetical protein
MMARRRRSVATSRHRARPGRFLLAHGLGPGERRGQALVEVTAGRDDRSCTAFNVKAGLGVGLGVGREKSRKSPSGRGARYNGGMLDEGLLNAVIEVLQQNTGVEAVWLFGSEASGKKTS